MSMRKYIVWVGALVLPVLATASCSSGGNENSSTQGDDALNAIPQFAHKELCPAISPALSGGKQMMHCHARVRTDKNGKIVASAAAAAPSGFGPSDIAAAYNLPSGGGAGVTIAIVDAQDNPDAEADLAKYRAQFGLPACTTANGCFKKVNQTGQASPLPTADSGWSGEISLDLDMASAVCPNCKLLLVEATSATTADLGASVNTAVALGATVVSNSYGGSEDGTESTSDSQYFNHPGVTIFASSGDGGYGVEYPASSAHVIGVGGTSLVKNSSARGWGETVWGSAANTNGGAGSGCSANVAKPSFQTDTGCSKRTVADVSAVADPNTGVAVYDTFSGGFVVFGGTSVASPLVASIFALTAKARSATAIPTRTPTSSTTSRRERTAAAAALTSARPRPATTARRASAHRTARRSRAAAAVASTRARRKTPGPTPARRTPVAAAVTRVAAAAAARTTSAPRAASS